jgi:hypothetical protein
LFFRERRNVLIDDVRKILRGCHASRHECGTSVARNGFPACDEIGHHLRHEQRQSIGPFVQRAHKRLVGRECWRPLRDVLGHFLLRGRIERDLLAEPVNTRLVAQRVQGVVEGDDARRKLASHMRRQFLGKTAPSRCDSSARASHGQVRFP